MLNNDSCSKWNCNSATQCKHIKIFIYKWMHTHTNAQLCRCVSAGILQLICYVHCIMCNKCICWNAIATSQSMMHFLASHCQPMVDESNRNALFVFVYSSRTKKFVLLASSQINVKTNVYPSHSHMPFLNMCYLLECGCGRGVRVVLFCFVFLNLIKNCFCEMPWVLAWYRVSYRYRGAVRVRS